MKLKKILLLTAVLSFATTLTACDENFKAVNGNEMVEGARTFNYAYVCSNVTGNKYYHISGWKEYGPEGGTHTDTYVGLEIQLAVSKDVVYYYEPNLCYVLTKNYNAEYGKAIE